MTADEAIAAGITIQAVGEITVISKRLTGEHAGGQYWVAGRCLNALQADMYTCLPSAIAILPAGTFLHDYA
jgi:hypothetical protein